MQEENDEFENETYQSGSLSRLGINVDEDEYMEETEEDVEETATVGAANILNNTTITQGHVNHNAGFIDLDDRIRQIVREELNTLDMTDFVGSLLETNIGSSLQHGNLSGILRESIRDFIIQKMQQF